MDLREGSQAALTLGDRDTTQREFVLRGLANRIGGFLSDDKHSVKVIRDAFLICDKRQTVKSSSCDRESDRGRSFNL